MKPFSLHSAFPRLPLLKGRGASVAFGIGLTLTIVCAVPFLMLLWPRSAHRQYSINGAAPQAFDFPLKISNAASGDFTVSFALNLAPIFPTTFHILPDDCLESMIINGRHVEDKQIPFCDYANGKTFDLAPYLHHGTNTVVAHVRNNGGDAQLFFRPTWNNPALFVPLLCVFVLFSLLLLLFLQSRAASSWVIHVALLFLFAFALRVHYLLTTPYWVRGHDTDGHIEYIEYLRNHFALPPPNAGWEFWQPPLYYLFGGVWLHITQFFFQFSRSEGLFSLQVASLLLTLVALALSLWIGLRLFPDRKERSKSLPLFFAFVAFFPGFILYTPRINNDVLALALSFAAVGLLLEWWKGRRHLHWFLLMVTIALVILTKNTGLLLLPVAYVCLLLQRSMRWRTKMLLGITGLLTVVLLAGWFTAYRKLQDGGQDLIIGNVNALNSALAVPNSPTTFLTFNPASLLRIPYNNAWSDAARRQNFWEYFYRSAFFGEFDFGTGKLPLARWLLFWSFPVALIGMAGCVLGLRRLWRPWLPLYLLFVFLLAGHLAFRVQFPFSCSQDFRYSTLLLLPMAAFVTLGVLRIPTETLRNIARFFVQVFLLFCCMFLLAP